MTDNQGRWVLAATILGSSMAFIDSTAVNVALPALQRELGADVAALQWIVEAYLLFLSALLLVGGALGDRYGRRRVFVLGTWLFALASIGCALAGDTRMLIAARALQGVGGALLVPGSLAIISASFDDAGRGRAIGIWAGYTSIMAAFGQTLAGWLVDVASWRAIFWLNLPLAVATVAIAAWHVPESRDPAAPERLDLAGAALATLGLGALIFGLIEAPERGLAEPSVLAALVGGGVALVGFFVLEARSRWPMMPPSLFRSPTFLGANLLTLLLYGALSGVMFFVPYNLIQVQGYSALATGAALTPFILLLFALSGWAGGLVEHHGARKPLIIGPIVAAVGCALFAWPDRGGSYWTTFFPGVLVLGLGFAIAVAPLTTAVMSAVSQSRAGVASGVNNAVARVGGLLAIAVFGLVIQAAFAPALERRLTEKGVPSAARADLLAERHQLAALAAPPDWPKARRADVDDAVDAAFVEGFRVAMALAAALALASAGAALVWIAEHPRPEDAGSGGR